MAYRDTNVRTRIATPPEVTCIGVTARALLRRNRSMRGLVRYRFSVAVAVSMIACCHALRLARDRTFARLVIGDVELHDGLHVAGGLRVARTTTRAVAFGTP